MRPSSIPCPCGQTAVIITGATLYPRRPDLAKKRFFRCVVCARYIGTHPDGSPLGTPADDATRAARRRAHAAFDSVWQNGWFKRGEAYAWLAKTLGLEQSACHMGSFDVETCNRVVAAVAALAADVRDATGSRNT